jgi:hypothetical protein
MAEITPSEISVQEEYTDSVLGTPVARKKVTIVATTTATSNTVDLSDYIDVSGIELIGPEMMNGAVAATSSTVSGTTITFAGHTGGGAYKGQFIVK